MMSALSVGSSRLAKVASAWSTTTMPSRVAYGFSPLVNSRFIALLDMHVLLHERVYEEVGEDGGVAELVDHWQAAGEDGDLDEGRGALGVDAELVAVRGEHSGHRSHHVGLTLEELGLVAGPVVVTSAVHRVLRRVQRHHHRADPLGGGVDHRHEGSHSINHVVLGVNGFDVVHQEPGVQEL